MDLCNRLAGFWLSDENVIYIGKATSLKTRIAAYYNTPLGNRGPHAGGHWVKTLSLAVLNQVCVYFAETASPEDAEDRLLAAFSQRVSESTKKALYDPTLPIPFANLKFRRRKMHGVSRSTLLR
jgi:hypothetical protein